MKEMQGVLPDWLARRAALTPDVPALVAAAGTWTFRQLNEAAVVAARHLSTLPLWQQAVQSRGRDAPKGGFPADRGEGFPPRIALLMGNTPQFVVGVHALAKLGAVLVPLNTRLAAPELTWQLHDAGALMLVHDTAHAEQARAVAARLPNIHLLDAEKAGTFTPISRDERTVSSDEVSSDGDLEADLSLRRTISLKDLHSIVYTSGTTGRPKGALLTYGNFWFNVTASALNLGTVAGDKWLACMPLFHVGGLSILLRSVICGMTVLLHESFDAAAVNQAIDTEKVTLLSVVAVMLERMLAQRGERPYPDTLRAVLLGGGPAPAFLVERALALRMPVLSTYGLTEAASQVATMPPGEAPRRIGSAGKPLFPVSVRILPIQREQAGGTAAEVAVGEVGEIAISGPTVTAGYWNAPTETAAVLQDGWFRTGDLGFIDKEGFLYVVDRREDLIISGGENVYPAEIEAVLSKHGDIEEAAVVGIADDEWGQVPAAVIVVRKGSSLTEDDVRSFCRQRLAAYKVPRRVVFTVELPRNAAGKVSRPRLRELL